MASNSSESSESGTQRSRDTDKASGFDSGLSGIRRSQKHEPRRRASGGYLTRNPQILAEVPKMELHESLSDFDIIEPAETMESEELSSSIEILSSPENKKVMPEYPTSPSVASDFTFASSDIDPAEIKRSITPTSALNNPNYPETGGSHDHLSELEIGRGDGTITSTSTRSPTTSNTHDQTSILSPPKSPSPPVPKSPPSPLVAAGWRGDTFLSRRQKFENTGLSKSPAPTVVPKISFRTKPLGASSSTTARPTTPQSSTTTGPIPQISTDLRSASPRPASGSGNRKVSQFSGEHPGLANREQSSVPKTPLQLTGGSRIQDFPVALSKTSTKALTKGLKDKVVNLDPRNRRRDLAPDSQQNVGKGIEKKSKEVDDEKRDTKGSSLFKTTVPLNPFMKGSEGSPEKSKVSDGSRTNTPQPPENPPNVDMTWADMKKALEEKDGTIESLKYNLISLRDESDSKIATLQSDISALKAHNNSLKGASNEIEKEHASEINILQDELRAAKTSNTSSTPSSDAEPDTVQYAERIKELELTVKSNEKEKQRLLSHIENQRAQIQQIEEKLPLDKQFASSVRGERDIKIHKLRAKVDEQNFAIIKAREDASKWKDMAIGLKNAVDETSSRLVEKHAKDLQRLRTENDEIKSQLELVTQEKEDVLERIGENEKGNLRWKRRAAKCKEELESLVSELQSSRTAKDGGSTKPEPVSNNESGISTTNTLFRDLELAIEKLRRELYSYKSSKESLERDLAQSEFKNTSDLEIYKAQAKAETNQLKEEIVDMGLANDSILKELFDSRAKLQDVVDVQRAFEIEKEAEIKKMTETLTSFTAENQLLVQKVKDLEKANLKALDENRISEATFTAEIKRLTDELETSQSDTNSLLQQIQRLEAANLEGIVNQNASISDFQEEIRQLNIKLEATKESYQAQSAIVEKLEAESAISSTAKESLNCKVKELTNEIQANESTKTALEKEIEKLQLEIQTLFGAQTRERTLESRIKDLQQANEAEKSMLSQEKEDLKAKIQTLIDSRDSELEHTKSELSRLETQIADLLRAQDRLIDPLELSNVKKELDNVKKLENDLQRKVSAHIERIAELEAEKNAITAAYNAEIQSLQQRCHIQGKEQEELKAQWEAEQITLTSEHQKAIQNLEARLESERHSHESEIEVKLHSIESLKEEISQLQQTVVSTDENCSNLIAGSHRENEELQKELDSQRNTCQTLEMLLKEHLQEIDSKVPEIPNQLYQPIARPGESGESRASDYDSIYSQERAGSLNPQKNTEQLRIDLIAKHETEQKKLESQIKSLRSELKERRATENSIGEQLKELKAGHRFQMKELKSQLRSRDTHIEKLMVDIRRLEDQNDSLQQIIQQRRAMETSEVYIEINRITVEVEDLRISAAGLQDKFERARAERDSQLLLTQRAEGQIRLLNDEIEEMQKAAQAAALEQRQTYAKLEDLKAVFSSQTETVEKIQQENKVLKAKVAYNDETIRNFNDIFEKSTYEIDGAQILRQQVEEKICEIERLQEIVHGQEEQVRKAQVAAFSNLETIKHRFLEDNEIEQKLKHEVFASLQKWVREYVPRRPILNNGQNSAGLSQTLNEISGGSGPLLAKYPQVVVQALLSHYAVGNFLKQPFRLLFPKHDISESEEVCRLLQGLYDSFCEVDELQGHDWRFKTFQLLSQARSSNISHGYCKEGQLDTLLLEYCNLMAQNFIHGHVAELLGPCQDELTRLEKLVKTFKGIAEVSLSLWSQKAFLKVKGFSYFKETPFSWDSPDVQAHPLHLLSRPGKTHSRDGDPITMLIQPEIVACGNEEGAEYDKEKVWAKAMVALAI